MPYLLLISNNFTNSSVVSEDEDNRASWDTGHISEEAVDFRPPGIPPMWGPPSAAKHDALEVNLASSNVLQRDNLQCRR